MEVVGRGGEGGVLKNHFFQCYSFGPSQASEKHETVLAPCAPFTQHRSSLCSENEPISISDWGDKELNKRACRATMREEQKTVLDRLAVDIPVEVTPKTKKKNTLNLISYILIFLCLINV